MEIDPEHGLGLRVVKQIAKKYRYGLHFQSQEGKGFEVKILMKQQNENDSQIVLTKWMNVLI